MAATPPPAPDLRRSVQVDLQRTGFPQRCSVDQQRAGPAFIEPGTRRNHEGCQFAGNARKAAIFHDSNPGALNRNPPCTRPSTGSGTVQVRRPRRPRRCASCRAHGPVVHRSGSCRLPPLPFRFRCRAYPPPVTRPAFADRRAENEFRRAGAIGRNGRTEERHERVVLRHQDVGGRRTLDLPGQQECQSHERQPDQPGPGVQQRQQQEAAVALPRPFSGARADRPRRARTSAGLYRLRTCPPATSARPRLIPPSMQPRPRKCNLACIHSPAHRTKQPAAAVF